MTMDASILCWLLYNMTENSDTTIHCFPQCAIEMIHPPHLNATRGLKFSPVVLRSGCDRKHVTWILLLAAVLPGEVYPTTDARVGWAEGEGEKCQRRSEHATVWD